MRSRATSVAERPIALQFLGSLGGWLTVVVLGMPSAQGQSLQPPRMAPEPIAEVRVVGQHWVDSAALRAVLETRAGEQLDRRVIGRDIERLMQLRRGDASVLADVQVRVEPALEGVAVVFEVTERPIIDAIDYEFSASREFTDDVPGWAGLVPGDLYDPAVVARAMTRIGDAYDERGHYLAQATASAIELDGMRIRLEVTVESFGPTRIRRVDLIGNEAVPDDELRALMRTRTGDILAFVNGSGELHDDVLEVDRQRLQAFYFDRGYLDARVHPPRVEAARDGRGVYVALTITEGGIYRAGAVAIEGDLLEPPEAMDEARVELQTGQLVRISVVDRDVERLSRLYHDAGFAQVDVEPDLDRRPDVGVADLTYRIRPGPRAVIGHISITGNAVTRDAVIRRELALLESDDYARTPLDRSEAQLMRLGLFEQVQIEERPRDGGRVVDLEVRVDERTLVDRGLSLGWGEVTGFRGLARLSTRNLLGRGQRLSLDGEYSKLVRRFSVEFLAPTLGTTRLQWGLRGAIDFRRHLDFDRESRGGAVSLGVPLGGGLGLGPAAGLVVAVGYRLEDVDVSLGGRRGHADRRFAHLVQSGRLSSLLARVTWDLRDDPVAPRRGSLQRVGVDLSDDWLGSDIGVVRVELASRWYRSAGPLLLRLNGEFGWVGSTRSGRSVPLSERYHLGGPTSVRGYQPYALSPREPVASDPSDPSAPLESLAVGGTRYLQLNVEVMFPVWERLRLDGVIWLDAGNAFDSDSPIVLVPDLLVGSETRLEDSLRTAAGFGIEWYRPLLGPLRVDVGFPLARGADDDAVVFWAELGSFF